jgi:glutamate dehydrogenase/leucine dehydrogenase
MLGPDVDILGVEIGTGDQEMVWVSDCYKKIRGHYDIKS